MTATDGEKDQRLRDIARRIREINAERATLEEKWQGQPPLDASVTLAALADELAALRRERDELQEPSFTPTMAKDYVERVWDMVSAIQKDDLPAINNRLNHMDTRMDALDSRLTTWFEHDATDRARGKLIAAFYRLVVVALLVALVIGVWGINLRQLVGVW